MRLVLPFLLLALACGDNTSPHAGLDASRSEVGSEELGTSVDARVSAEDAATDTAVPVPGHCDDGPLEVPIPNCRPAPLPSTGDPAADCVQRINQFRAECQCLPPLQRWVEGESCAAEHAEYDSDGRPAHSGFSDRICENGGRAQNECPSYRSADSIISTCLQQMWDEGPGEPFIEHGHYINMTNPAHSRVACGMFIRDDGRVWAVQNFR
ncbi:MAG: CAP domain-containing protein [Myxococcota bacterium]